MPSQTARLALVALPGQLAAMFAAGALAAQAPPPYPAYAAAQFACARFTERVRTGVRTETGDRTHRSTIDREGVWLFHGDADRSSVALEGWLDTLTVSRVTDSVSVTPDAGGVLGGRFRGTLASDGRISVETRPFVPDEVAEIDRVDRALDDLFPRLPTRVLRVGESWREPPALEIRRVADSADAAGRPLLRLHLTDHREGTEQDGDSLPVDQRQVTDETTEISWSRVRGLMDVERHVLVVSVLPPGRVLGRTVRTTLEQRQRLVRDPDPPPHT